jgi:hypothetical protein
MKKLPPNYELVSDKSYILIEGDLYGNTGSDYKNANWQKIIKWAGKTYGDILENQSSRGLIARYLGKRTILPPVKESKKEYEPIKDKKIKLHNNIPYYFQYNNSLPGGALSSKPIYMDFVENYGSPNGRSAAYWEKAYDIIIFTLKPRFKLKRGFPFGY